MKFSKIVFAFFLFASIFLTVGFAQNQTAVSENSVIVENPESNQIVDETQLSLGTNTAANAETRTPSTAWLLIRMILVLALVLACAYFAIRFMKKGINPDANDDPFLRQVSSVSLGNGKSVQVVTLIDNAYILGVSDSSVNLIGELKDKELIEAMNLYADKKEKTKKARNFEDVLAIFMPSKSVKKDKGIFSDTSKSVSDFIKEQRNKIDGTEKW